jgi:hypothetical protein
MRPTTRDYKRTSVVQHVGLTWTARVTITVRSTVGAIPTPSSERGKSVTPTVATGHQSVERGETWRNTEPNGAKLQADTAMVQTCDRSVVIIEAAYVGYWLRPKRQGSRLGDRYNPSVHSLTIPALSTDLQQINTNGWNGETPLKGSCRRSIRQAGDQAACPKGSRIAQEANAGGNAPDMQTWAR